MKVDRDDALSLFTQLEFKAHENWDNFQLGQKLSMLNHLPTEGKQLGKDEKVLLEKVLHCIKYKEEITVMDTPNPINLVAPAKNQESEGDDEDELGTAADASHESEPVAESEKEDATKAEENETMSATATEEAPVKKKRGRPAKAKSEENGESTNGSAKPEKSTKENKVRKIAHKEGTEFTKEYKGKTISVTVTAEGYDYNGKSYTSLTNVAKKVTGAASISGPRFFGLAESKN